MSVLGKAPNPVIIVCATIVVLAVLGAATVLIVENKNTDQLLQVINVILSGTGALLGAGSWLYAGAAARQADTAATSITNGVMDRKIQYAVRSAIAEHDRQLRTAGLLTASAPGVPPAGSPGQ